MKALTPFLFVLILASSCFTPIPRGPVTITNDLGGWSVHYIYIVRPGGKGWGSDWLGVREVIRPGASRVFMVPQGTWNIRIIDSDGDTYTRWNITVTEDGYTWNLSLADMDLEGGQSFPNIRGNCPVTLRNSLNTALDSVWISPADHDRWGYSILEVPVAPGAEHTFWVRQGQYDLKARDASGMDYVVYNGIIPENGFFWDITGDYAENR